MNIIKLFISPLKSGRMIEHNHPHFSHGVFNHDRTLMLVDKNSREFLSQRKLPKMALIRQAFSGSDLELILPGYNLIKIQGLYAVGLKDPNVEVDVWTKDGEKFRQCILQSEEISKCLSIFLGREVELVAQSHTHLHSKECGGHMMQIALHDSSAIHLVTKESLRAIGLDEPLDVTARRFRPNIVVKSHKDPFWEDTLDGKILTLETREFAAQGIHRFLVRKLTGRCQVPGINPQTGERDNAPMKFLSKHRREGNDIFFGIYLFPLTQSGGMSIGNRFRILEQ